MEADIQIKGLVKVVRIVERIVTDAECPSNHSIKGIMLYHNCGQIFLSNPHILPGLKDLQKGEKLQVFLSRGMYAMIYNSKGRQLYYHNPENNS